MSIASRHSVSVLLVKPRQWYYFTNKRVIDPIKVIRIVETYISQAMPFSTSPTKHPIADLLNPAFQSCTINVPEPMMPIIIKITNPSLRNTILKFVARNTKIKLTIPIPTQNFHDGLCSSFSIFITPLLFISK